LTPYLYWPFVHGARRFAERAVLHPAAHDEWMLNLRAHDKSFRSAGAIICYTEAERAVVNRRFPFVRPQRQLVLGLGADAPVEGGSLPEGVAPPYLLCLGRVDRGKGTHWLARSMAAMPDRTLVIAGPGSIAEPVPANVRVVGEVDDATKWALLRHADALVSPSANESYGIVLLEAWAVGTPVLVNARCAATVELVRASGGGAWFDGVGQLSAALSLVDAAYGECGRRYVTDVMSWDAVTQRYAAFLGHQANSGVK
jgi:glycosyltransferase involved in cell wall biosynthesis